MERTHFGSGIWSYRRRSTGAIFDLVDLARVEVLRGPQGTLYGRNATGGAVQFISNQPTRELDGYGSVTVGSYGQIISEGAVSGPLTDNLQVRVAGTRNRDKGYIRNINPGEAAKIRARWEQLKGATETFVRSCEGGNFAGLRPEEGDHA